jgi:hypothetical protein
MGCVIHKDCATKWRAPGKEYEAGSVGVPPDLRRPAVRHEGVVRQPEQG